MIRIGVVETKPGIAKISNAQHAAAQIAVDLFTRKRYIIWQVDEWVFTKLGQRANEIIKITLSVNLSYWFTIAFISDDEPDVS